MKMTGRIIALLTAVIGLAGCVPTSGVVTQTSGATGAQIGATVPDVEYQSKEGKQASFNKVRQPVAVIAFVAPQGANCCSLDPGVVNIADQLWDLPVTVAQFSLPTSKCPHGPGCVEACNLRKGRVMSLCDAQRLAWDAYGKPAPGTLILIGPDNKIVAKASLHDPKAVVVAAQELGRVESEKERGPGGERLGVY
jgi:hypothetical protein